MKVQKIQSLLGHDQEFIFYCNYVEKPSEGLQQRYNKSNQLSQYPLLPSQSLSLSLPSPHPSLPLSPFDSRISVLVRFMITQISQFPLTASIEHHSLLQWLISKNNLCNFPNHFFKFKLFVLNIFPPHRLDCKCRLDHLNNANKKNTRCPGWHGSVD